jgi:hypothetical protein
MADVLFELYRRKDLTKSQLLDAAKNNYLKQGVGLGLLLASVPFSYDEFDCFLPTICSTCKYEYGTQYKHLNELYLNDVNGITCEDCIISCDLFKQYKLSNGYKGSNWPNENNAKEVSTLEYLFQRFIKQEEIRKINPQQYQCDFCYEHPLDHEDFIIQIDSSYYCQSCEIILEVVDVLHPSSSSSSSSMILPSDICDIIVNYLVPCHQRDKLTIKNIPILLYGNSFEKKLTSKFLPKSSLKKSMQSICKKKIFETIDYNSFDIMNKIVDAAKDWIGDENENNYTIKYEFVDGWSGHFDILIYCAHSFLLPINTMCRLLSNHLSRYVLQVVKEYVEFVNNGKTKKEKELKEDEEEKEDKYFRGLISIDYENHFYGSDDEVDKKNFILLCRDAFAIIKKDWKCWLPDFRKEEVDYIEEDAKIDNESFDISLLEKITLKKCTQ